MSGFYINPMFGGYTVFVSIQEGGAWQGGQISAPSTYTVQAGDTLWGIAAAFYGDPLQWPTIYNNNRAVIGANPNLIFAGQVLNLGGQGVTVGTQTYTVVAGDTLWSIAGRLLGSPLQWVTIYNQNKAIIGTNPNLIHAGQVLTIGIPPVAAYSIPYETDRWYTLPSSQMATKVRFTFTNLYAWAGLWVAAVRELEIGTNPSVSATQKNVFDMAVTPSGAGYWVIGANGNIVAYGDAGSYGNLAGTSLPAAIVGGAATASGKGYWLADANGTVYRFGDTANYGSVAVNTLTGPIVAIRKAGNGFWMAGADGGVFTFGGLNFYGSGYPSTVAVVDMAARPQADGYWLLKQNGTVVPFGGAASHGNGSLSLGSLYVGMESTASGNGYWLVTNDGTVSASGRGQPRRHQHRQPGSPGIGNQT